VVGDKQNGPSTKNADINHNIPLVNISHVSLSVPNHNSVSLYTVRYSKDRFQHIQPLIHMVGLKGKSGLMTKVEGLFDDGALVNSICNSMFATLRDQLGELIPSNKTLLMADGAQILSHGQWVGDVILGGRTAHANFEIFPSGGGWSLLFRKPLLQQFKAVHNYDNDTLMIPFYGDWNTLVNECGRTPMAGLNLLGKSNDILRGDDEHPLRQVSSSDKIISERVDKQEPMEPIVLIPEYKDIHNLSHLSKPIVG
jgi:hypothetical protein